MDRLSLIDEYAEDCRLRGLAITPIYVSHVKALERHVQKDLTLAGKPDLKAYLAHLKGRGLKYRTIEMKYTALNSFYGYLEDEELIKFNPVPAIQKRYLKRYKENDSEARRAISIEEAARLAASIFSTRDRAIFLLLLKTGIRRHELCDLNVEDVDLLRGEIILKESAKISNRLRFLDGEASFALSRWLQVRREKAGNDLPALFLSQEGQRISKKQVGTLITGHAVGVGLHKPGGKLEERFTPHCCRHFFTTCLLEAGMREADVAWLRGDADRFSHSRYHHVDVERVRESYLAHIPQLGI